MGQKNGWKSIFTAKLLRWNRDVNRRQMPWKGEKDPYRIWLSEVILQQTRVEQGWNYYERFLERYPTIQELADAPDDQVFKLWEGLGYYSRCRNLLYTARFISFEKEGSFPTEYAEISALKGVGDYTASAIASFAFDLPHAVVDGNVVRVLTRFFGIISPVDSTSTKKDIKTLANQLLDIENPAVYNQAMMDFGATVCKPKAPLCDICPLSRDCIAYARNMVNQLPVKSRKPERKKRYFHYIVFEYNGLVYVKKRDEKDIWKDLFEFYLIESHQLIDPVELIEQEDFRKIAVKNYEVVHISSIHKQQLTHQEITGVFIHVKLKAPLVSLESHIAVSQKSLNGLAFPKFILSYLREKNVN